MKNFNVFGFHWKIQLSGGGRFTKNEYRRGGLGEFADLRGDLARKRGWCVLGDGD